MYAPTEGGSGDDIGRPMPDRLRVKLVGCAPFAGRPFNITDGCFYLAIGCSCCSFNKDF